MDVSNEDGVTSYTDCHSRHIIIVLTLYYLLKLLIQYSGIHVRVITMNSIHILSSDYVGIVRNIIQLCFFNKL